MTKRDPAVTICQIQDHARKAMELTAARKREDMETDDLLPLALARLLHIIGEAATRLPEEVRDSYSNVQWREIIGLRHRLVHAYDDIDHEILWRIVCEDLPKLLDKLEGGPRDHT